VSESSFIEAFKRYGMMKAYVLHPLSAGLGVTSEVLKVKSEIFKNTKRSLTFLLSVDLVAIRPASETHRKHILGY
jgi:hypothetical protein